jgi:pimeloyl-ACP methyl ester carboxylesterase
MTMIWKTVLALALAISSLATAQAQATGGSAARVADGAILDRTVDVGAQRVHYLQAGSGPTAIILLHGWPQSSHEWRRVMPLLARQFTVIAPDLRGIGGTSAPDDRFDKVTLARDVHALVEKLGLRRVVVAGHDIGGMVAYAYARTYPGEVLGVSVMDVPLPGHEAEYIRYFVDSRAHDPKAIPDEDIATFAAAYGTPDSLRSGFEFYRAIKADGRVNASRSEPLNVPILLLGGEFSMGQLEPKLDAALRRLGATNLRTAIIPASGHWVGEENPAATAAALATFALGLPARP